jgi:hypothetical protein
VAWLGANQSRGRDVLVKPEHVRGIPSLLEPGQSFVVVRAVGGRNTIVAGTQEVDIGSTGAERLRRRVEVASPLDLGVVGGGIRPSRHDIQEVRCPALAESRRVGGDPRDRTPKVVDVDLGTRRDRRSMKAYERIDRLIG